MVTDHTAVNMYVNNELQKAIPSGKIWNKIHKYIIFIYGFKLLLIVSSIKLVRLGILQKMQTVEVIIYAKNGDFQHENL